MTPKQGKRLRSLPSVSDLLEDEQARRWCAASSRACVVGALRSAVDQARSRILSDGDLDTPIDSQLILQLAEENLKERSRASLQPVINATGVVLHTGLGRAPLCDAAVDAIVRGASGYTNLEYDLKTGRRGRRQNHVSELLRDITGAEAATVVNNNAAAMLLVMRALCEGREVIVSRGQLVEIGGSFRMPDVMAAGGAILREVGTTNRTRIADYESAVGENTGALLRVHHSNFRIVGFTEQASAEQIVHCAHTHELIAVDDLGSGAMFDLTRIGLPTEPFVAQSISAGFDIVCFSGDKLLGGPQAGLILGRGELIDRIESHPLMRTYRLDKLVLLALEATLRHHLDPETAAKQIPILAMLSATTETLAERARTLEQKLSTALPGEQFFVGSDTGLAGGGSLPGEELETVVIRWRPSLASVESVVTSLRQSSPPVVARVSDDAITLDLRTLRDEDFDPLVATIAQIQA